MKILSLPKSDSKWISVSCELKYLTTVLCVTSKNSYSSFKDTGCYNHTVRNHGVCYDFHWFNGFIHHLSDLYLMNSSIRIKINIARFAFLFNALDDEQLILLSLNNTSFPLINMFEHKKPWLKVKYDEKTIPYDRASGYFVFKKEMHKFRLDLGNRFLTRNGELMSSPCFVTYL